MSVLLLTMGPQLGITADLPVVGVGGAGVIRFRAIGAVGPVKWTLADSTLPAEWDSALNPDGDAVTLTTSDAETAGTFSVTVRAVDNQRVPVVRTFSVWVEPEDITVAAGGTQDWIVGTPVSLPLAITGGTGVYVSANVSSGSLPAGVTAQVSGSTLQISGTPSAIADDGAVITVSDSRGARGVTSVDWEVTSPPKILIAGSFTQISGATATRMARLEESGVLDTSFVAETDQPARQVTTLPGGGLLINGLFLNVNGVARQRIAKLNQDGSLDTSFVCAANGEIIRTAVQHDGKIICAGAFSNVNGSSGTQRYARINPDGTTDTSFGPCSASAPVGDVLLLPSGKILVGGTFSTIGGASRPLLALLNADGTVDTSFNASMTGTGVQMLLLQDDGKVIVGGNYTNILGSGKAKIARLNSDLTLDTSWDAWMNTNFPTGGILLANGNTLVWGSFNALWDGSAYQTRLGIGVIDKTTGYATSFAPLPSGPGVQAAAEMPDGNIFVAGGFTAIGGSVRTRIALLTAGGVAVPGFVPTANGGVQAAGLQFL